VAAQITPLGAHFSVKSNSADKIPKITSKMSAPIRIFH